MKTQTSHATWQSGQMPRALGKEAGRLPETFLCQELAQRLPDRSIVADGVLFGRRGRQKAEQVIRTSRRAEQQQ